ncbi:MAG: helix-turn-helix domain-containing protein [Firmicutes bacterium]|nr:helix-turn-helix domain-containing protein [Bacillota bacterium]
MNLSENIKKIRKENNLSQEQLAEKLGVSRQSVSKWESGQAYPEMDKVLQICELFNLNMDELMKSDLKEVRETKQSKANVNKFIDDFLGFITKTVDMFSSMKFKSKIKCFVEQVIIALILFLLFFIGGSFGSVLFSRIFSFINNNFYWILLNIFEAIYLIIATILFVVIFLHIFKVRYLDYYIFLKEDKEETINTESKNEKREDEKEHIELSKKQEKIVIRDPKHSGYKFLNGLLTCALFFIKIIVFFIGLCFIFSLLVLGIASVLPFVIIKARFFFWGSLICILACIIINLVILKLIYNFLISKKTKKSIMGIIFALSVIFLGIGSGILAIGLTNLSYVEKLDSDEIIKTTIELEMTEDLVLDLIYYNNNVEYIESKNENILIEIYHSKYIDVDTYSYNYNYIGMTSYLNDYRVFDIIKAYVKDLNNYEIKDRKHTITKVYGTKENLEKLKENLKVQNDLEMYYQNEIASFKEYYEEIINRYEEQIKNLNEYIARLEYEA